MVRLQEEPYCKTLAEIAEMTPMQISDLLTGSEDLEPRLRAKRMTPLALQRAKQVGYIPANGF